MIKTQAKKKKTVDQTLIEQRLEYQDAVADYEQLKRSIQATMKDTRCSFEHALEKMFYNALWDKACKRLEKIKNVLKDHYKEENLSII